MNDFNAMKPKPYEVNSFPRGVEGASMSTSERLLQWHSLWQIQGDIVTCRTCRIEQRENEKALVFAHSQRCKYFGFPSFPWGDLDCFQTEFVP